MEARTVQVTLGGQKRTLRYDLRAMQAYERYSTFVLEDGTIVKGSIVGGAMPQSANEFVALILACLEAGAKADRKPAPGREEVEEWLFEDGALERMISEVLGVIGLNSPTGTGEGDDGPPDPPRSGDGSPTPTPSESSSSG